MVTIVAQHWRHRTAIESLREMALKPPGSVAYVLVDVGIVTGVLATIATAWQGTLRWRAAHSRSILEIVVWFRERLSRAVAHGGPSTHTFGADEPRQHEQRLRDLVPRLNDGKLKGLIERLLAELRAAWAHAPTPYVHIHGAPPDQKRARQVAESSEHTRLALIAIDDVMARLVQRDRWIMTR